MPILNTDEDQVSYSLSLASQLDSVSAAILHNDMLTRFVIEGYPLKGIRYTHENAYERLHFNQKIFDSALIKLFKSHYVKSLGDCYYRIFETPCTGSRNWTFCSHHYFVFTKRPIKNGKFQYWMQCVECGRPLGQALSLQQIADNEIYEWDEKLFRHGVSSKGFDKIPKPQKS